MQGNDQRLRSFLAIARAGSLRQAAETMQISAPALSRQLTSLERSLNTALFRRHSRGMEMTTMGQALFNQLNRGYELIDRAVDRVRDEGSGSTRTMSLSVVNTMAAYLVPELIRRLALKHPGVDISINATDSPRVVESVERGYADIGLAYDISVNTNLVTVHRLHHEVLVAYCATTDNLPENLDAAALAASRLILPPRPYVLRRMVEREVGANCSPAIESNSVVLSLDLAAKGQGIAILPLHLPEFMIASRNLVRVPILKGTLKRPTAAIHRSNPAPNDVVRTALAIIESLVGELLEGSGVKTF